MQTDDQTSYPAPISRSGSFLRGFLIRLVYGLLGILLIAFIRPDLFSEKLTRILAPLSVYLLICLAGGAFDAATRPTREIKLFQKPKLVYVVIFLIVMIRLWLSR